MCKAKIGLYFTFSYCSFFPAVYTPQSIGKTNIYQHICGVNSWLWLTGQNLIHQSHPKIVLGPIHMKWLLAESSSPEGAHVKSWIQIQVERITSPKSQLKPVNLFEACDYAFTLKNKKCFHTQKTRLHYPSKSSKTKDKQIHNVKL